MEWNWSWLFGRKEGDARAAGARCAHLEPRRVEDWEARLVEEGVSDEWASRLAQRLEAQHRQQGEGSAQALILGAVAATEMQAESHAWAERNVRDVKEVERLLGAFSGELEKLDEVLEVLAAYAQRMRARPDRKPRHTLH
ncbi:MAG: hypothetical protein ACPGVZ_10220 [Myxococcota bacterium]